MDHRSCVAKKRSLKPQQAPWLGAFSSLEHPFRSGDFPLSELIKFASVRDFELVMITP
jgi:hypothetical protein